MPNYNLSYVLITPARNEEEHIGKVLESVVAQSVKPACWVIVNDGSTDRTGEIAAEHARRHSWIRIVDMPAHRDRSFAAKVSCFNAGMNALGSLDFDVIGNLDADISFEEDYLEFLLDKFSADPQLGVAGTTFREAGGYDTAVDSFEGFQHVAGGCQMFRRSCFEEIGGYIPNKAGGIDWIAVTTARMKGWKTRSFREKYFYHHRSLGTAERGQLASAFSYGEKDYYLGNSPLWQIFRITYQMSGRPYLLGGLALGSGYLWAALRRIHRPVSAELMRFHRREQMAKLGAILKSLIRWRKVDSFQLLPSEEEGVSKSS